MVPDGWKNVELNEVAPVIDCKHRTPSYSETGIPIVSPGNITWGALKLDGCRTISELEYDSMMDHCEVEVGDLVFGRNQTVGVAARVESTQKFALGQDTVLIKPKTIDSQFLQAVLQSQETKRQIYRLLGGSTFGRINLKDLRQMHIVFPYPEEQQRIAETFSTWDRAIETTKKLISNSQAQKKALMQQLLTGKKRLPGFDGEWALKKLSEIGVISSAGVDKKFVEGETPVRLLNFLDAYNREFIWSSDLTQEVTAPSAKVTQCDVRRGDVFFTPSSETRNDIGLAAVAAENMPGVVYSYHVVRLRPKVPLDLNFSAYVFQTDHFRRQTYRAGDGSGQRYVVSQNLFRAMDVLIPPFSEQKAIGKVLLSCSTEILQLQANLKALKVEKAALMQQLLTGKRRVKIEEAAA